MAEIVRMPKLSDTMTDGVVAKWHKKVGDKVKSGELLADIETDKATMEFESFQDGVLIHIGTEEGKSVPVDSVLAILGKGGEDINAILAIANSKGTVKTEGAIKNEGAKETEEKKETVSSTATSNHQPQTTNNSERIKASPLAKAIAKEKGIDVTQVNGTGDNGLLALTSHLPPLQQHQYEREHTF